MVKIWTGNKLSYFGSDGLDITIKGKDSIGRIFAPTWKMVLDLKRGLINNEIYEAQYHQLMLQSYRSHRTIWDSILSREEVVLLCYCKKGDFCHRLLLARYLEKLGGEYCGEV